MSGQPDPNNPPPVVPPVTPPVAGDWTASLSPDHKTFVTTKGYKTPGDVLDAYTAAERLIGADKVEVPKDGKWSDAALLKLGVPKDGAYQLTRPAADKLPAGMVYDEAFEKAALPAAAALGLTPVQVQGLMDFYTAYGAKGWTEADAAGKQIGEAAAAELKTEWGQAYDAKLSLSQRAAKHFGGDKLVQFLNSSGMGNNPELVRAFAKIGAEMPEGKLRTGTGNGFSLTPAEARTEANKLMATDAYKVRSHPEHDATVQKVQDFFQAAYPDG